MLISQVNVDSFQEATRNSKPTVRVYNNANITIAHNTLTVLTFNSERWDRWDMHSTSSNTSRITIDVPGWYWVGATVRFDSSSVGNLRAVLMKVNGTTYIGQQQFGPPPGGAAHVSVSIPYQFAKNDYVEVEVFQDSGGNLDVISAADRSPEFWALWHSRA